MCTVVIQLLISIEELSNLGHVFTSKSLKMLFGVDDSISCL